MGMNGALRTISGIFHTLYGRGFQRLVGVRQLFYRLVARVFLSRERLRVSCMAALRSPTCPGLSPSSSNCVSRSLLSSGARSSSDFQKSLLIISAHLERYNVRRRESLIRSSLYFVDCSPGQGVLPVSPATVRAEQC